MFRDILTGAAHRSPGNLTARARFPHTAWAVFGRASRASCMCVVAICALLIMLTTSVMASAGSEAADSGYAFDSGDLLSIHVAGQPDLSIEISVDDRGNITLPLVGRTLVRGMDAAAAEKAIAAKLEELQFIRGARVTVWAKELRPIYVMGDVRSPGVYPFRSHLTVKNAVAIAGGFGKGQYVAGDTVIEASELVRQLHQEQVTLRVRQARLKAQLARKKNFDAPADLAHENRDAVSRIVDEEQQILNSRINALDQQLAILQKQLEHNRNKIEASERQEKLGEQQRKLFADRLNRHLELQERGIVREKEGFELRRDENIQRTLAVGLAADRARNEADAVAVESRIKDLQSDFDQLTLKDLSTVGDRLRALAVSILTAVAVYRYRRAKVGEVGLNEPPRSITIVRTKDGKPETMVASELSQLQPGDLVEIKTLTSSMPLGAVWAPEAPAQDVPGRVSQAPGASLN